MSKPTRDTPETAPEESPSESSRRPLNSGPEIKLEYAPVGRETWAAITGELGTSSGFRRPMTTKPYGDRISNAPGARGPSRAPNDGSPEITVGQSGVGRDTMAAINSELEQGVREELPDQLVALEMVTFVVKGPVSELSGESARRRFVEERLIHRLPSASMDIVERIDVTPWTERGTVILRIWCRVS